MQIHETWVATAVDCLGFFGHSSSVHTFAYINMITYYEYNWYFLLFSPFAPGFSAARVRCHQRGGSSVKRLRCSQCFQSHCKVLHMLLSAQWWLSAGSAVHQLQILLGLQASWKQAAEVLTWSPTQWSTLGVPESWSDNKSIQNQSKCKDVDVLIHGILPSFRILGTHQFGKWRHFRAINKPSQAPQI